MGFFVWGKGVLDARKDIAETPGFAWESLQSDISFSYAHFLSK